MKWFTTALAIGAILLLSTLVSAGSVFVTGIPNGGVGNQDFPGSIGDTFTVGANDLLLTEVGVFDSPPAGLSLGITFELWTGGTGDIGLARSLVVTQAFLADPGANGVLSGTHRFLDIPDITLLAGMSYTVVAYGYGGAEKNYNEYISPFESVDFSTDGLTAGTGGYNASPGANPNVFNWYGPAFQPGNNLGAASFRYEEIVGGSGLVPVPAAAPLGLLGMGILLIARRRRR